MKPYVVFATVALLASIGPAAAQSSISGQRKPAGQIGGPTTAANPVVPQPRAARASLPAKPATSAPQPRPAH
ncbi:hypothetical protein JQ615_35225 [Bradyrhizobium jicamae]|uniref:Uncharacterized protein n=1 Tax=Bradyrhizobium jicamae TaxID=280332 RepID=A0ABS5FUW1_9BRAD|nr:hypothetical protein [Bradyrhizobium jicamae]MBR0800628.1 hypothetical protein [Bradyrhizobium jicamae]MBR0933069.1 hypothetical protein [Bradyrhizobium jicamae]